MYYRKCGHAPKPSWRLNAPAGMFAFQRFSGKLGERRWFDPSLPAPFLPVRQILGKYQRETCVIRLGGVSYP